MMVYLTWAGDEYGRGVLGVFPTELAALQAAQEWATYLKAQDGDPDLPWPWVNRLTPWERSPEGYWPGVRAYVDLTMRKRLTLEVEPRRVIGHLSADDITIEPEP